MYVCAYGESKERVFQRSASVTAVESHGAAAGSVARLSLHALGER
jgi:hypothetical protein